MPSPCGQKRSLRLTSFNIDQVIVIRAVSTHPVLGRLDAAQIAARRADRRSGSRSADSQSLEHIANGVRQRSPDSGTMIAELSERETRRIRVGRRELFRGRPALATDEATEPPSESFNENASCRS